MREVLSGIIFITTLLFLFVSCSSNQKKQDNIAVVKQAISTNNDLVYLTGDDPLGNNEVRIHYKRNNNDYDNFVVWAWGDDVDFDDSKGWPHGVILSGKTNFGVYYDLPLKSVKPTSLGFLLVDETKGDAGKDRGDKKFSKLSSFREIYVIEGSDKVFTSADDALKNMK
jgi:hypothetical protein